MPKAAIAEVLKLSPDSTSNSAASFGLEAGKPASMR
jgi:hypothetical protein